MRTGKSSPERCRCPRPRLKGRVSRSCYIEPDNAQGAGKQRSQDHARYDKATRKARSKIPLSVVSGLYSQTCCERKVQCLPPSQPGRYLRDFPACRRVN